MPKPPAALFVIAAFTALVAVLVFKGLGHAAYWDDEAYVVFMARQLAHGGHMSLWDGRNLYLPRNGYGYAGTLSSVLPPLDVYLCAASFRLFGDSETSARLPFAALAIATVPLYGAMIRRQFPRRLSLLVFAMISLCLSCAFLLNARTCRYNIAALFLSVATYAAFDKARREKNVLAYALLVSCATLLFYSSYIGCAALLCALAVSHFAVRRLETQPAEWRNLAVSAVVFLALTVPYAVVHRIGTFAYKTTSQSWLSTHLTLLGWNFRDLNLWNVLPWSLSIAALVYLVRGRHRLADAPERRGAWECLAILVTYVVVIAALSPQPPSESPIADIRYLVPALPWAAALSAVVLWRAQIKSPLLGIGATFMLVGTNALTLLPSPIAQQAPYTAMFRLMLPDYVHEISRPYPTRIGEVVAYLRPRLHGDDNVVTRPEFYEAPLIVYLGDRIRICCQLDKKTTPVPESVVRKLGGPISRDENFPDWYITLAPSPEISKDIAYFSRPYRLNGRLVRRSYSVATVLVDHYEMSQRPELPWHSFGPMPRLGTPDPVYIYKSSSPMATLSTLALKP